MAFGTTSSQLFVAHLRERRTLFGRIDGPLLRSASNRNYGAPFSAADRPGTCGLGHRPDRQYAGHRDLATTMRYIHLSGRELAARFQRANVTIHADRERLPASLLEER